MRNIIPFFTRIPIKGDFEKARKELWALPLLTPITSSLSMMIIYFNLPLKEILAILALYTTIGLLHLDGLADWADGIMVKGNQEKKIKAMKDLNTGIAGIFAVVVIFLVQVYSLTYLPFYAIFLAELNSKYAMLLALATKKSLGSGLGTYFMEKIDKKQLATGTLFYIILLFIVGFHEPKAILSVLGLLTGIYVTKISLNNFGGLNGDCIGAVGETTRAGTLLLLAFIGWNP
ncbi:adenosylcobinamide-GDP ribazoletransferase [Thermococcus sp. MV5]|uniref:adenosylcobinamide-GDP ribazoletransferase n=1 Tax=Thermococcus sp. MV5 TaxID=1638272 RepID=UPI00143C4A3F|nr:adenosylcobinamide-GDP ribazoletransferase [Thermococcus sp. MV5]NJE26723.1 adenosylcobinamide-GDP ribazoletransferase [Thermococcus sp. MV5]